MVLPILAAAFVALVVVLRARGGRHTPDRLERAYLAAAPLPLVLVLVVPVVVGWTLGFDAHSRPWIHRATWAGLGLSFALVTAGGVLIRRAIAGRRSWGWPLAGGVLVAAAPAAIMVVTYALMALVPVLIR